MNCKYIVLSAAVLLGSMLCAEEAVVYEDDYTRFDLEKPYQRFQGAVVRQETKENGGFRYLEFQENGKAWLLQNNGFYVGGGYPALYIRSKVRFQEFKMRTLNKDETQTIQTISFSLRGGDAGCSLVLSPFGVVLTYIKPEAVTPEAKAKREEDTKTGKWKVSWSYASKDKASFTPQLPFATWLDIDVLISGTTLTLTVKDGDKVIQKYEKTDLIPGNGGAGVSVMDKIAVGPLLVTVPEN